MSVAQTTVDHTDANSVLMRRVAFAAVGTASFLVLLKTVAFVLTGSIAMMASLADSALDVIASFVNLLAIRHALTPADAEHRFGHGKAEPLAGLAQSAFIGGSSVFLVIESVRRIIEPHIIHRGDAGLLVMGVSIVVTIVLVAAQQITVRRTGSIAIGADRMHYVSDILVNAGVALGIVLASKFGITVADPAVGLLVAGVLAVGVWQVFRQSYDQLMDRELPDAERARIENIVMRHPDVRNVHDLRTRAAGTTAFIQLHIELDPAISLLRSHAVSDEVEAAVLQAFPKAEVIIHQDPQGYGAPEGLP
ncbi:MAG: cation diffusion facilitator family transporter [Alphaproteobacteria bacterium]|nr:cation diffusion facilitator family transporter [Alphaproteobacteria bacterium]MDE2111173.1 cation diffusion facilitator family transporter [Alphaproteobacteria bacterium]MDE2495991.1 cation diffusion facilitator family transporter [Alphaproteobacteria bacterium]